MMDKFRPSLFLVLTTQVTIGQEPPPVPLSVHVTGTLLDDRYRPAADVAIAMVTADDHDIAAVLATPLTKSDADGSFAVDITLPSGKASYLVVGGQRFAIHRQWLRVEKHPDGRPAATTVNDVGTVTLAAGFTATGRVRDEQGKPVAGARISGSDLLDGSEWLQRSGVRMQCHTGTAVPANGIFQLTGMVRSAGKIRVQCEGYCDVVIAPVAIGTPLDVTLQRAPTVHGRVVDQDDKPIVGQLVRAGISRATTAEDGTFSLQLRERHVTTVSTSVYRAGRRISDERPLPTDGQLPEQPIELRLDLTSTAANATGVVVRAVDADGRAVPEFEAYVSWNPSNQLQYRPDAQMLARAARDQNHHGKSEDGVARMACEPANARDDVGIVWVRATGHGWGRAQVGRDAVGGDDIVVTLPRPSIVRGRAVDDAGEPIAGLEIIATQELADTERDHFVQGFHAIDALSGAPCNTRTDDDGRWQIDDAPPGKLHLFAYAPDRLVAPPQTVEIEAGTELIARTFTLPRNLALKGKFAKLPFAGATVRPHWHRPNMSSSGWRTEVDGTVPVSADGSFTFPELQPKPHLIELLLPAPPRGGIPFKLPTEIWNGEQHAEPIDCGTLECSVVTGTIAGDVPWSRLAVLVTWQDANMFNHRYAPDGPLALVDERRAFSLMLPQRQVRIILLDPVTGITLAFRDLMVDELTRSIEFAGGSKTLALDLHDVDANVQRPVDISYTPIEDHWPMPQQQFVFNGGEHKGMVSTAYTGGDVRLWLPAASGVLELKSGTGTWSVEVGEIGSERVALEVGADVIRVRK